MTTEDRADDRREAIDTLIANEGILGPKVKLGEIAKPYRWGLGSTATTGTGANAELEVGRKTVRSLGETARFRDAHEDAHGVELMHGRR